MAKVVTAQAPPLPRPWVMRQRWRNLAFLHWVVDRASIAGLYPPGTHADTFEGRCYVGLVAFRMADTGLGRGPALLPTFPETNIRLYSVDETGRRGVVFLSLDAARLDFVVGARAVVGVPYRWARMTYAERGGCHSYSSILRWPKVTAASTLAVRVGAPMMPGPLEHFLTARWGAHVHRAGRTWYWRNAHPAWTLRAAEVLDFTDDGLFASVGLNGVGDRAPDHVAFSDGVPACFGLPLRATQLTQRSHGGRNRAGSW